MEDRTRFRDKAAYLAWRKSAELKLAETRPTSHINARADSLQRVATTTSDEAGRSPFDELEVPGPTRVARHHQIWALLALLLFIGGLAIWVTNYVRVAQPVEKELRSDARNSGFSLRAHYAYFVNPRVVVLDLTDVRSVAPTDLFRGLFQSAKALAVAERQFERVVLARSGKPIFLMAGADFRSLGTQFAAGQNPVYLVRTLPEKLHRPTGEDAFAHWEGGMLGVLSKQMEDATQAAKLWAGAAPGSQDRNSSNQD